MSRSKYFQLVSLYKARFGVKKGKQSITEDHLSILGRAVALVRSGKVRSYEEAFTYLRAEELGGLTDLKALLRDLSLRVERLDEKGVRAILTILGVILKELEQLGQDLYQVRLVLHGSLYPMAQQDADVRPHLKPVPLPMGKAVLQARAEEEAEARQPEEAPKKTPWYLD